MNIIEARNAAGPGGKIKRAAWDSHINVDDNATLNFASAIAEDWEVVKEPLKVGDVVRIGHSEAIGTIICLREDEAWVDREFEAGCATYYLNRLTRVR